jgi:Lrp/AsnC family transcriptional regulator for asnA, asnC and gidA
MRKRIDRLDKEMLSVFAADGRTSVADLAVKVGVARPTATNRVKRLLDNSVLRFSGLIDANRIGGLTLALVGLKLEHRSTDETVDAVAALADVSWAAVVTGRYDIIAQVITDQGLDGLHAFVSGPLRGVDGIASSELFVVMKSTHKWSQLTPGLIDAWAPKDS